MKRAVVSTIVEWALPLFLAAMSNLTHAAQLVIYLDTDGNSGTGCTITLPAPPGGSFQGAEIVLTTEVNTSTSPPTVGAITQQSCASPPSTLGAPAAVSAGGWPVGVGLGVAGYDVIETFFPANMLAGNYRVGFLYTEPAVASGSDALLTSDGSAGGASIFFSFASPAAMQIPTLTRVGILFLALGLAGFAVVALRRYKLPGTLGLAVFAMLLAATAVAITLDGMINDWEGVPPAAIDPTGDAPPRADISAAFVKFEPADVRVYFRADVKTTIAPAITSVNSTTFTVGAPGSFTVTTSGFPAPSLMRTGTLPGGVSFADNGNGTGTLAGVATAAGTFPLAFTASNVAGASPTQNFTLNVLPGSQTITFTTTAPAGAQVARSPYPVAAVSSAGLPVVLTIDATAAGVCTLSGSTVYFTGAGTCVINANAAGNANYNAAPQVQQSFAVSALTQSTPSTPFTDDFNSGSTLGGSWVEQAGHYAVAAVATGQAATNLAVLNGVSTATVTVGAEVAMPTGSFAGLVVRYTGPGDANMYVGNIDRLADGSCVATLYRSTAGGALTAIGTGGAFAACATGTLNLEITGSSLTLKFNNVTVATATDSSIAGAGSVGIRSSAGVTFDNFFAQ